MRRREAQRRELIRETAEAFQKVTDFLKKDGRLLVEKKIENPAKPDKCDVTMGFDHEAESIAIKHYEEKLSFPIRILTEERGEVILGRSPEWTLVMDPTDGSTNYGRGIESTAFSVGIVPEGEIVTPKNVDVAFIGSTWSGNVWSAVKGEGARYNGEICHSSEITELGKALIGMDLDFNMDEKWKWARIMPIIEECHMIRRGGAAALDAAYVAHGGYDAIIDVRDKSTPENFMAAYLIITEAGGIFTDPFGNELPEVDLSKKYNWIGSGNQKLHEQILKTLNMNVKV
jgi:myo-inositol-1(or 4)-monophosphatase